MPEAPASSSAHPVSALPVLRLESLSEGIPAVYIGDHHWLLNKCVASMDAQGHSSGVPLKVDWDGQERREFSLTWDVEVTEQLRRANADSVEAVEDSARAVAFLLIREMTDYTAVEQARRGTRIDYYLGRQDRLDDFIFNGVGGDSVALLEISGIACGTSADVNRRIKEKETRFGDGDSMALYIVVLEHGVPLAKAVVKS